jgi:hypothetical protein
MKKLLLILLVIPFFGCEKFELPSEPSVAGKWYFDDYRITIVRSVNGETRFDDNITVIKTDTICINNFGQQSFVSGNVLPSQSTYFPLIINNDMNSDIDVKIPRPYLPNKYGDYINTEMRVTNYNNGNVTDFTFTTDKFGAGYSRVMTLTSPYISTDLYLNGGQREKALTVFVTLIFKRN